MNHVAHPRQLPVRGETTQVHLETQLQTSVHLHLYQENAVQIKCRNLVLTFRNQGKSTALRSRRKFAVVNNPSDLTIFHRKFKKWLIVELNARFDLNFNEWEKTKETEWH